MKSKSPADESTSITDRSNKLKNIQTGIIMPYYGQLKIGLYSNVIYPVKSLHFLYKTTDYCGMDFESSRRVMDAVIDCCNFAIIFSNSFGSVQQ